MGDLPRWDPLGRRARLDRLMVSIAVAAVSGVVLWNVLECHVVQRWIWGHGRWGRLENWLDLAAIAIVPLGYLTTSVLLRRSDRRQWLASRIPQARVRRSP